MRLINFSFSLIISIIALSVDFQTQAATINDTVYINRGTMVAVDAANMPYFAFNASEAFNTENKRILISVNDILNLTIINTDAIQHGINVKNYSGVESYIAPGDSVDITVSFTNPGVHIYYDPTASINYSYMGLAGMIVVTDPGSTASRFFWNMKEHQLSYNEDLAQEINVDWSQYYPDYFTINGNSNPDINNDPVARVTGNVGDTIHIYMVNTGVSLHSIHFHGYHSTIKYSTKFPSHVGRLKDTFPIYSMEAVVIELIPDKVGEYPVHDHNLVAVSGGHIYPNGMFLTLLIE